MVGLQQYFTTFQRILLASEEAWPPWVSALVAVLLGVMSLLTCLKRTNDAASKPPTASATPVAISPAVPPENQENSKGISTSEHTASGVDKNVDLSQNFAWDIKPKSTDDQQGTDLNSLKDEENPLLNAKLRDKLVKNVGKEPNKPADSKPASKAPEPPKQPKEAAKPKNLSKEAVTSQPNKMSKEKTVMKTIDPTILKSTQDGESKKEGNTQTQSSVRLKKKQVSKQVSVKEQSVMKENKSHMAPVNTMATTADKTVNVPVQTEQKPAESSVMKKPGFFGRLFGRSAEKEKEKQEKSGDSQKKAANVKAVPDRPDRDVDSMKTKKTAVSMAPVDTRMP